MKFLILFCVLFPASRANAELEGYEFWFAPVAGYSNDDGVRAGYDVAHLMPVSEHWQSKIRVAWIFHTRATYSSNVSGGVVYNFSKDLPRSTFLGAGVGYGNDNKGLIQKKWNDGYGNTPFAYLEFGQRFKLTKSGSFSYVPTAAFLMSGSDHFDYVLRVINVSWNF